MFLTLGRMHLRTWLQHNAIPKPWLVATGLLAAGSSSDRLPDAPSLTWPSVFAPVAQQAEAVLELFLGKQQMVYASSTLQRGSWAELVRLEWEVAAALGLSLALVVLLALRCCRRRAARPPVPIAAA